MRVITYLTFISVLMSCLVVHTSVFSQTKPSKSPEHIAFLDHIKLRKDYPHYAAEREVQLKKFSDLKINHEKKLKDEQTNLLELIAADSITGGRKKQELEGNSARKIGELEANLAKAKKKVHEENIKLMQNFEKRIVTAIDEVVREKGYTDVKPVQMDTPKENTDDITNLVLKKLK